MPGKIKVKVLAGRNLPVMDRASDTTDAFVEIKFGSITHKTDVCRKSLNPHWNNTEWYRFEVDESELQDEPLQLRLMDHDTYSANDAIGKVVISLAPLLAREANNAKSTAAPHGGAVMSGWIPVFDTMHGIRGELNVIVKVELFSDFNKYKTSSCGVQFFHCPMIPPGYRATSIHGFVEELVVNDDPEYQWIDKIRTPRASNEARQVAFIKLSNQVQRLVGLKAAELGANAVVGYQQDFDLEGEAGVVARAIGTAVSITPLPMPSQTLNMPPCTQQQLKKYLDILATDNESISEMSTYYQCHQEELQNLLLILNPNASALLDETDALEEDEKSMDMTRQSSITSYAGSASIYQDDYPHRRSLKHLSEDQTDLNRLLNKDSDDSDSSGPIEKLKKIKTNFFTKRFTKRSSNKRSSIDKQDDSISLRSNASDTSRISLVDIKNELKKFKGLRKPKFRKPFVNKEAEGEGMASILARSIIHVQTSLACIAETQDSEASPGSTMQRTSECEPTVNMSDDDTAKVDSEEAKKIPEIRYTSLNNISTEEIHVPPRERKISESCPATPMPDRSENLLTLPGDVGYFGSVSSALSADSSELESSSEEDDDESSDLKTDNERSIETTSSVVQSVLNHDLNPQFIASMDKKLNVLESAGPDLKEVKPMDIKKEIDKKAVVEQQVFDTQVLIDKCKSLECVPQEMESNIVIENPVRSNEASTSSVKDDMCVIKPSSHHIKLHNPFSHKKPAKSISEPSSPVDKGSFVHRSSRRIRRQLSKLSKSSMIKSISHYSLHPKKKETKIPLSQPGSSSDIHSKAPSETVLGSPFLSFNDLMSLDKESIDTNKFFHKSDDLDHAKVSMYIGSEPVSRCSLSGISSSYHREEPHHHEKKHSIKSTGLVHSAMETILLDKVQSLLMPASPDPESVKNKQFFNDVNEKLGLVEEYRNNNNNDSVGSSINLSPSNRLESQSPPVSNKPVVVSGIRKEKIHEHKSKPPSLMQTAMETMLMDQVQSVLMSTTPETSQPEFRFEGNELPEPHEQHKNMARKSISYIQSLLGPKSPDHTSPTERFFDSKKKKEAMSTGLVHTAMETMLMEKVQSVLGPETPEPVSSVFDYYDRPEEYDHHHKKDDKSHSLFQTAIETMLLEKVQASALGSTLPDPVISTDEERHHELHKSESSTGMTQSAMETMLMDRVTTLVGQSDVPHVNPHHFDEDQHDKKSIKDDLKPTGLVHSAFETMLLEKVQASALSGSVPDPVISTDEEKYHELHKTDSSTGMTHTAMETMLMDKITSLVGQSDLPHVNPDNFDEDESEKRDKKSIKDDLKPTGLVHSAFETILLEKVQASALGGSVPDPVISTDEEKYHELHKTDCSTGMTHTAMETMLMDKITSLVGQSDLPHVNPDNFDEDESEKHDKKSIKDDLKPTGLVHSAFETILLEKVQASALGGSVPDPVISTDEEKYHELHKTDSSTGMTHTAMETMLMDKITSLVGQSDLPHVNPDNFDEDESEKHDKKSIKDDLKPTGLVHSAFETILLEKIQASALGGSLPDPVISTDEEKYHELHKTDSSTGMTHTAMETMLMDKITSLVGEPEVPHVEPHHFIEKELEKHDNTSMKDDIQPTGLIHTAVETVLLDKVQASSLGTPVPVVPTEDDHNLKSHEKEELAGLTHTAMETILMDKVQSLVGQKGITFVEPKTFSENELEEAEHLNDDLKSPGLVKSVVKNILLDKVNTLAEEKEIAVEKSLSTENLRSSGLVHTAFENVLLEKEQTLRPPETTDDKKKVEKVERDEPPGIISTVIDKIQSLLPTIEVGMTDETKTIEKPEAKQNNKKLIRQDSVHSITENETPKMSKKSNKSSSDVTKPVLHIHGALETIPSLPETQDDVDETNNSVCDNTHAVCGVNRNERERDKREDKCDKDRGSPRHARHESYGGREPVQTAHAQNSSLNATSAPLGIHRRSSDSDLSVTPKGGSLNTSAGNVGSGGGAILRPSMNSNNLDMLEYPFLTMTEYAPGFIVHIGGTVCARSVKLADGGEGAARAAWWAELRTELRAHARALRCNAVIAYTENTAICEDVCVLSASGTAAVINLDCDFNAELDPSTATTGSKNALDDLESELCSMAHVPYSPGAGPYRAELSTCGGCRRARVPTVLLATCSKPSKLTSHAKAVTLTAVAARVRRAPPTSEPGARDISDQLPFLEYELHKLLLAKLRMQGANALFSLQTQISIGERCVMALASGTACRLGALPPPAPPRIKASENDKDALEIQKALWDSFSANRAANGFDIGGFEHATNGALPEVDGEEAPALDLCADKDACVLELDEAEDVETARALAKRHVNMQVYTHGLKPVMGAQPQAFAQVWRGRLALSGGAGSSAVERHVRRALDGVAYKLRRLQPCALVAPRFQLELPEDEIQLIVSGSAIPLQDPNTPEANGVDNSNHSSSQHSSHSSSHTSSHTSTGSSQCSQAHGNGDADDEIFTLDEEQLAKSPPEVVEEKSFVNGQVPTTVSLTTLSHISGGRVSRRLCALRLLFVRETTAVRELGGLSGFLHTFTCEVMAIVRAYTAALGGNALTSFYITQLMLQDNAHKNQGQCLLSVGGDIVHITY